MTGFNGHKGMKTDNAGFKLMDMCSVYFVRVLLLQPGDKNGDKADIRLDPTDSFTILEP